jgi:hypothetical protein
MQNAPARQPRVSPAAPGAGHAWVTAAFLVGAVILAGAVVLPPFAAGYLFPSRSTASPPRPTAQSSARAASLPIAAETTSAASRTTSVTAAATGDKADGNVETRYSDLPLRTEPANEPPRSAAPAGGALTGSALATGVFGPRTAPEAATADEPSIGLALPAIPPLGAASVEVRPGVSPPPVRRGPLPLKTDLLPAEMPGPPPLAKPGPDRHG